MYHKERGMIHTGPHEPITPEAKQAGRAWFDSVKFDREPLLHVAIRLGISCADVRAYRDGRKAPPPPRGVRP